jgi:hypothetical protein
MEKRYRALRTIGTIYKILGIITGALTILVVIGICGTSVLGGTALGNAGRDYGNSLMPYGMMGGALGGILGSLIVVLYGGTLTITLYGFGEGVYLLLALEENTRATTTLLARQLGQEAPKP